MKRISDIDSAAADIGALADIVGLSSDQEALLGELMEREGIASPEERTTIPRRALHQAPLSFAQRRLWFLEQLRPHTPLYNLPLALHLEGSLDLRALKQALDALVTRHEALRTIIPSENGEPVQVILDPQPVMLNASSEAGTALFEEARRPFDLARGPLVRFHLQRRAPDDHVLLLVLHHIIADAWSLNLLFEEFAALYETFAKGGSPRLSPLPLQYSDFAVWQRETLSPEKQAEQLAYWRAQLSHPPAGLNLPTDRTRSADSESRGAIQSICLPRSLSRKLREFCRQEQVTPFMVLLGAFQTLLHRYTGQDDLLIGSLMSNRTRVELEGVVGFFVNTVALRAKFAANPSFREVLANARETSLAAAANQEVPFERVIEEIQLHRNGDQLPLLQAVFSLEHDTKRSRRSANVTLTPTDLHTGVAKFDLALSLTERGEDLRAGLEYNTDLFDQPTIARALNHYQTLLQSILASPGARVSELEFLGESERKLLLCDLNDTRESWPGRPCVHELFEDQAKKTPHAVAAVFNDQHLTYGELDARANQLAYWLREKQVGPEIRVGIFMERSVEMLASLLGVLKAGGAYLPLDLRYPKERLAFMLQDAQPAVILTQRQCLDALPPSRAQILCLDPCDGERSLSEANGTYYDQPRPHPDNLAYVIYTSGSTGRPKGVEVPHRAVVNFLNSVRKIPGLDSKDVLFAVTPLSFDIAALELFLPLVAGARVVIARDDVVADGAALAQALRDSGATVMQATPATWRLLLQSGWTGDPKLKLLCGGEAISLPLANELSNCCGSLWNLYGPTETTIWSTVAPIAPRARLVSLGRPVANTRVYLLDRYGQPVPRGVPGEFCIAGGGVTRGYRHRPELTAERFVPDPFSSEPGARLYKTGDLVRGLPDGLLEFLGRIDHQIKIRGHRIELGEIEFALLQHAAVGECVVAAPRASGNDPPLIAYVVLKRDHLATAKNLHEFLKRKLPGPMMPSAFVLLDRLPRTPNGKVDRSALPAPGAAHRVRPKRFIAPRTSVEKTLAAILSDVLGLEPIGIHDNFFDQGGHSLLATQVISRIHAACRVELPVRCLFEGPTVAELAREVSERQSTSSIHSPAIGKRRTRQQAAQLLARIDQLSDGEVEALLAKRMASEGEATP